MATAVDIEEPGIGEADTGSADRVSARPVRVCFLIDRLARAGTESQLLALIRNVDSDVVRPYLVLLDGEANAAPVLRQLELLVMPSVWEAAGLLATEAMALGIPVLGSNCAGLREVLRDTPSFTFPAGDVVALSRSLKEAILRPRAEEARSFAAEARRRFNGEHSARSLLETFRRVTG